MKHCAFLTLDETADFVIDDEHAIGPLNELGWQVSTVSWRQTSMAWSEFDLVIIRSTWDYWDVVPAFLESLQTIDQATRLANRLDIVKWNLSKRYLQDLQNNGVGIVPTLWERSPGQDSFTRFQAELGTTDLVIKPDVGAHGVDAFRVTSDTAQEQLAAVVACFDKRDCMVQSFMPCILSEGEYSLFFFNGVYSHSILKVPAANEFRSQEERGAEIRPVSAPDKLLQSAQGALNALSSIPLYARVDMVRTSDDAFVVMELELIEPSLYLRTDPKAPMRFAAAIDDWYEEETRT